MESGGHIHGYGHAVYIHTEIGGIHGPQVGALIVFRTARRQLRSPPGLQGAEGGGAHGVERRSRAGVDRGRVVGI